LWKLLKNYTFNSDGPFNNHIFNFENS
jgi:hypothetical protein